MNKQEPVPISLVLACLMYMLDSIWRERQANEEMNAQESKSETGNNHDLLNGAWPLFFSHSDAPPFLISFCMIVWANGGKSKFGCFIFPVYEGGGRGGENGDRDQDQDWDWEWEWEWEREKRIIIESIACVPWSMVEWTLGHRVDLDSDVSSLVCLADHGHTLSLLNHFSWPAVEVWWDAFA